MEPGRQTDKESEGKTGKENDPDKLLQYHGRAPVASSVSVTLCSNAALDVWICGTFRQFPLMQPIDCAMVGFNTISHTDGMPRGGDFPVPTPTACVFVVL